MYIYIYIYIYIYQVSTDTLENQRNSEHLLTLVDVSMRIDNMVVCTRVESPCLNVNIIAQCGAFEYMN